MVGSIRSDSTPPDGEHAGAPEAALVACSRGVVLALWARPPADCPPPPSALCRGGGLGLGGRRIAAPPSDLRVITDGDAPRRCTCAGCAGCASACGEPTAAVAMASCAAATWPRPPTASPPAPPPLEARAWAHRRTKAGADVGDRDSSAPPRRRPSCPVDARAAVTKALAPRPSPSQLVLAPSPPPPPLRLGSEACASRSSASPPSGILQRRPMPGDVRRCHDNGGLPPTSLPLTLPLPPPAPQRPAALATPPPPPSMGRPGALDSGVRLPPPPPPPPLPAPPASNTAATTPSPVWRLLAAACRPDKRHCDVASPSATAPPLLPALPLSPRGCWLAARCGVPDVASLPLSPPAPRCSRCCGEADEACSPVDDAGRVRRA
eukprot:362292-Chlamydomonas_euryale.AAC.2